MNDDERAATRRVEELLHALDALTDAVEARGGPELDCSPKGPCRACAARARVVVAIDELRTVREALLCESIHRGPA